MTLIDDKMENEYFLCYEIEKISDALRVMLMGENDEDPKKDSACCCYLYSKSNSKVQTSEIIVAARLLAYPQRDESLAFCAVKHTLELQSIVLGFFLCIRT